MERLSGIVLATYLVGKKPIIQITGRLLRSKKNKLPPVVIDLIDDVLIKCGLGDSVINKEKVYKDEFECKIIHTDVNTIIL